MSQLKKYLDDGGLETLVGLLKASLATKQDKISNMSLSHNDFSDTYKTKLDGVSAGAQVNKIETISVNGTAIPVLSKTVSLTVPTLTSQLTNDSNFVTTTTLAGKVDKVTGKGLSTVDFTGYVTTGSKSGVTPGSKATAEGTNVSATGDYSHAEGSGTEATRTAAHAEGLQSKANGANAHAEGNLSAAAGDSSHAEGYKTQAAGTASHAEGSTAVALGASSHAQGIGTVAAGEAQTAIGKYNKSDANNKYALIVGNGTSDTTRSDVVYVGWDGYIYSSGISTLDGTIKIAMNDIATNGALTTKVDKRTGYALSKNDFDDTYKGKLDGIATNAQVNVIETVKLNGTPGTITGKTVELTYPTKLSAFNNDPGYQTKTQVEAAIKAVAGFDVDAARTVVAEANATLDRLTDTAPTVTGSSDGWMSAGDKRKLDNIEEYAQANPEFFQKGRYLYVRSSGQPAGVFGPFAVAEGEETSDLNMMITYTGSLATGNLNLTAHVYDGATELTDAEVFLLGALKWYNASDDPQVTTRLAVGKTYKVTQAGAYKCILDGGVAQEGSE